MYLCDPLAALGIQFLILLMVHTYVLECAITWNIGWTDSASAITFEYLLIHQLIISLQYWDRWLTAHFAAKWFFWMRNLTLIGYDKFLIASMSRNKVPLVLFKVLSTRLCKWCRLPQLKRMMIQSNPFNSLKQPASLNSRSRRFKSTLSPNNLFLLHGWPTFTHKRVLSPPLILSITGIIGMNPNLRAIRRYSLGLKVLAL